MQVILNRINTVPGVIGSLICNAQGEVLASAFPPSSDLEALTIVARTGAQTATAAHRASRNKVLEICATYDGGRFILYNMRSGYLCVLSGPQINLPLLSLTIAGAASALPEMIEQWVRGQVRPATTAEPLDALSQLIEKLVQEIGDRGIGRQQLLHILGRRLERLQAKLPLLADVKTGGGVVDLTALKSRSNSEITTAVFMMVGAICQTSMGMLGRDATSAKYRQVWDPFWRQNEELVRRLSLDTILDRVDSLEGGLLPGLDVKL